MKIITVKEFYVLIYCLEDFKRRYDDVEDFTADVKIEEDEENEDEYWIIARCRNGKGDYYTYEDPLGDIDHDYAEFQLTRRVLIEKMNYK